MDLIPNAVNAAPILLVGLSLNYVMRGAVRSDLMNLALAFGHQQRSAG